MNVAKIRVAKEVVGLGQDAGSGAHIFQITSAPQINSNIYCEIPFMDPESRYVFFYRSKDSYGPVEIWRADMRDFSLRWACDGVSPVGMSFDHRHFVAIRESVDGFGLLLIDVETLDISSYEFAGGMRRTSHLTMDADLRRAVCGVRIENNSGILKLNLERGTQELIYEHPEVVNPHPQVDPGNPEQILVQHNRGSVVEDGRVVRLVGEAGATLFLMDWNGNSIRTLPVGKPHTPPCQGHQCWIGKTGEILLAVVGSDDPSAPGCLLALKPSDSQAREVARGYHFIHPNASRDGRFFVSDTMGNALVVGSISTGASRPLCKGFSPMCMPSPQYTHPHPYFSPDNKWVIFNSYSTGIPHVCAAQVPEGMLEELDT